MVKKELNTEDLQSIIGGGLPTPSWNQLLNSVCGFLDGWNGKKKAGHC